MTRKNKYLIVIAGPTAVGKTAAALEIARHLGCEIVSADSRQVYRELNIGTAKPNTWELASVPHHFIDSHSIEQTFSAGQYEQEALACLEGLFQSYDHAVLCGGSGLYVKALCEGMDELPPVSPKIREELQILFAQRGMEALQNLLKEKDPSYFGQADQANPQRLMRALEVCLSSGKTYSSFRTGQAKKRPFNILKIGLEMPREQLYARIDQRMDLMIEQGLAEECKQLAGYQNHNALQTVGYQEVFDFFKSLYDWPECVRLLKRNSRRYAKRQLTWFKKDPEFIWLPAGNTDLLLNTLHTLLKGE